MARRFVFVNDFFIGNAINYTYVFCVSSSSSSFVASLNSFNHFFNCSTQSRAQRSIVCVYFNGLARAFAGLCGIGHVCFFLVLLSVLNTKPRILVFFNAFGKKKSNLHSTKVAGFQSSYDKSSAVAPAQSSG